MTKIIEPEIKIVEYVWFNQVQAYKFGLNHSQAIIMNYFSLILPTFCTDVQIIKGKPYYWCSVKKPLSDMPTLQVSESTMRNNINHLIAVWILEREVNPQRTKAYYRVTEKWTRETLNFGKPADFPILYNNIETLFKEKRLTESQLVKLKNLLSSTEQEERPLQFQEIDSGPKVIVKISDKLKSIKDWKSKVKLKTKENFDEDYIISLGKYITELWDANWWTNRWVDWMIPDDVQNKICLKLDVLFNWYEGKTIKNLKQTFYQWFNDKRV